MNHSGIAVTLDGFLYEEAVRGDRCEATARFRLVVSHTDEVVDEMVVVCTATTPALVAAVLHELAPGDQLRITGYLCLPCTPDEPFWLDVTTLEVLWAAPLNRLPCRMRQVTWLWALGTPTAHTAQQMRISPSTVRVHLYQARQRLAADPILTQIAGLTES